MDAKRLEREIHKNPFDTFMDFHVEKAESESMILTFENKGSKWDNPNGTMYGGVLYSMADSAMEAACAVCGKSRPHTGPGHELPAPGLCQYGHPGRSQDHP